MVADQVKLFAPESPMERVKISICRQSWRLLDFDNCVSSMKACIDGLVVGGIMADDGYLNTGPWTVTQKHRKKNLGPLLEITIEEQPA